MNRRPLLAGLGTGIAAVAAGCLGLRELSLLRGADHLLQISNQRETSHEVVVDFELDGEETERGPKTVEPNATWQIERFETPGTLAVRFYVDGERIWDDTHEIPTLDGDRTSFTQVTLLPDGEVLTEVKRED